VTGVRTLSRAVAFGLALQAATAWGAKTDVVVLKNGDHLTGEVNQLERGRLTFKTDDMGTVEIEWDNVQSVTASAPFDVDDLAGQRYLGSLAPGAGAGQVILAWKGRTHAVALAEIVRIRRLYTSFWRRLDGSLDVGASYTSASELFKADLAGTIGFERPGYEVSLDGSSTLTTQPDADETRRSLLSFSYARRFPDWWVALAETQVEQNKELGFDLRSSATVGGGRYLLQAPKHRLLAVAGFSLNRERPTEGESTTNVEATMAFSYDRFSYDFPNLDVSVAAGGFASLNDGGRYRVDVDAQLKREIVRDFYATLRGYESYDSRPATEGAPENDYGITFALGWSF
jgi:uncharacterized protein DUF481